jgi:DNA polymerase/3'-5' exonuclease PolX
MHKNSVSAEQAKIKALTEQLRVLELQQKEQELEGQVKNRAFWIKHQNLRNTLEGMKQNVRETGAFVSHDVIPFIGKGVAETVKVYRKGKL